MSEAVRGGALGVDLTRAAAAAMGQMRDVSWSGNGVVQHGDGIFHLEADSIRGGSGGHGVGRRTIRLSDVKQLSLMLSSASRPRS